MISAIICVVNNLQAFTKNYRGGFKMKKVIMTLMTGALAVMAFMMPFSNPVTINAQQDEFGSIDICPYMPKKITKAQCEQLKRDAHKGDAAYYKKANKCAVKVGAPGIMAAVTSGNLYGAFITAGSGWFLCMAGY